MLSVLVVILRPDYIAGLSLSFGEREIVLIASLRVLKAPRFGAGNIRCLADLGRCVFIIVLEPLCMAHSLVMAGEICPVPQDGNQGDRHLHRRCRCPTCTIRSGKTVPGKTLAISGADRFDRRGGPANYTRYL
jgi:hypothetical protein